MRGFLFLLLLPGLVLAGPPRDVSLNQAIGEARNHYNGKVLSAETRRTKGRDTHNVRILTKDGRVRRYRVDAESGRRLKPRH